MGTHDEETLHLGHLLLGRVVGLLGPVIMALRLVH